LNRTSSVCKYIVHWLKSNTPHKEWVWDYYIVLAKNLLWKHKQCYGVSTNPNRRQFGSGRKCTVRRKKKVYIGQNFRIGGWGWGKITKWITW
jgi:hypothetical protein